MTEGLIDVAAFDGVSAAAAMELVRPACTSTMWLAAVVAGRPYGSLAAVVETSDGVIGRLRWPDVEEALAAHPRIGERPAGDDRESAWSRQEQAAAGDLAGELREANIAYEERFGWVFLICATGRSPEEMLAAARARVAHESVAEQAVVRDELAAIVRLRLARTLR